MHIRTRASIAAVAFAVAAPLLVTTSAYADSSVPDDAPAPISGTATPEEEREVREELKDAPKVDMYYRGEKVDPKSDDLNGAQVCAEVSEDGTMECFDTEQESNKQLAKQAPTAGARMGAALAASTRKYEDCPNGWVCLWQDADYSGRRLQWPTYDESKTRHLNQYSPSFRDKASSAYVNRPQRGVWLYDFRSGMPDPKLVLGAKYSLWPNFTKYSYPYGGNWNDKADAIKF
ncbi:peptidase inhibitor family I36 protein [Streptomyces sp. E11-3]|uniref:peptidase inhibitor family I36 protein n=1 Tax=Streptomyces sp. E11-3 TaxID=3110112 RepID=UPI00397FB3CA